MSRRERGHRPRRPRLQACEDLVGTSRRATRDPAKSVIGPPRAMGFRKGRLSAHGFRFAIRERQSASQLGELPPPLRSSAVSIRSAWFETAALGPRDADAEP